jgi:quercetin dioxygenase-like cupin family protein
MDNLPVTIESLESNGGIRSVTKAVFPPGAKAVRHYHTEYEETFKVLMGQLTLIKNGKKIAVNAGDLSPTIKMRDVHTYINESSADVTVEIILQPGHKGCEIANHLFVVLARHKKSYLFSKTYSLFMIAFYEITNTIPVGIAGIAYSLLKLIYGRKKIAEYKASLLKLV